MFCFSLVCSFFFFLLELNNKLPRRTRRKKQWNWDWTPTWSPGDQKSCSAPSNLPASLEYCCKIHAVMLPSQWSLQPNEVCMCEEFVLGGNTWNTAVTCWLKNKHPQIDVILNCPIDSPTPHNKTVLSLLGLSSAAVSMSAQTSM